MSAMRVEHRTRRVLVYPPFPSCPPAMRPEWASGIRPSGAIILRDLVGIPHRSAASESFAQVLHGHGAIGTELLVASRLALNCWAIGCREN